MWFHNWSCGQKIKWKVRFIIIYRYIVLILSVNTTKHNKRESDSDAIENNNFEAKIKWVWESNVTCTLNNWILLSLFIAWSQNFGLRYFVWIQNLENKNGFCIDIIQIKTQMHYRIRGFLFFKIFVISLAHSFNPYDPLHEYSKWMDGNTS